MTPCLTAGCTGYATPLERLCPECKREMDQMMQEYRQHEQARKARLKRVVAYGELLRACREDSRHELLWQSGQMARWKHL